MSRLVLKIAYSKRNYRIIEISDNTSYHDLHLIIQSVFEMENDHLYGFARGHQYYGGDLIVNGNPFQADENRVLKMDMFESKQHFTYLYDFGEDHHFSIQIENILRSDDERKYELIKSVGRSFVDL
jgi:hypothetical protein